MELKRVQGRNASQDAQLLIVPYGIETTLKTPYVASLITFNRTLWN